MSSAHSSQDKKFIEFQHSWPLRTIPAFVHHEFNQQFQSVFKTVHNNISIDWKCKVSPNGAIGADGLQHRGHLSFFLHYNKGLLSQLSDIDYLLFVNGASLQQCNFKWVSGKEFKERGGWRILKFLPHQQMQGLIKDDMLHLAVRIKIPEEHFLWKNICEKKKAELARNSGNDFSGIANSICVTQSEERPQSDAAHTLDFKIKTADEYVIWCHKVALGENERFQNLMSNPNFIESVENRVESDFRAVVMKEIVLFIYTDKVSEDFHNSDVEKICAAAHYYEVAGLKLACEQRMIEALCIDNVNKMLKLADRYDLAILKDMCFNLASENLPAVGLFACVRSGQLSEGLCEEILDTNQKRLRAVKILPPIVP